MKKIAFLILLIFTLTASGCSAQLSGNGATITDTVDAAIIINESAGIDKTVPVNAFNVSQDDVISSAVGQSDFGKTFADAAELSAVAEYVVLGEVLNVQYTDDGGIPRIHYDFKLNEVLRGNFKEKDIITVSQFGGYVRGDVFAKVYGDEKFDRRLTSSDLIHYSLNDAPEPMVGDTYVLFLADDELLKGGFAVYGEFMGKYIVTKNGLNRYVLESNPHIYSFDNQQKQETMEDVYSAVETVPLQDDSKKSTN